jgi:hypothetical protein
LNQKFEKNTLRFLLIFGLIAFITLIRKPPAKDWIIIFLFKGYLSSILNKMVVHKGYIRYPVKLFKSFDISIIFDYLLFPVSCIYYNQVTKSANIIGIILKTFCFSVPMTLIEHFFETRTSLISYKKGWNSYVSLISITITFLLSRGFIAIIRKANNKPVPES